MGVVRLLADCKDDDLKGIRGVSWIVTPTYRLGRPLWRKFLRLAPRGWITDLHGSERMPDSIEIGAAKIEFLTAEAPDKLVAEGLRRVLIDECGIVKESVWAESIRPALIDHEAPAYFLGTPKGRNWFYRMALRGWDPADPTVETFGGPSHMNPFIKASELEQLRLDMPERVYRQEILAEFLTDDGAVFRRVRDRMWRPGWPLPGPTAGFGIDLAKHVDFTVIVGMDKSGIVTEFDRFNKVSWSLQKERIRKRCGTVLPVVLDSTGPGDPILDDLLAAGVNAQGYRFGQTSKIQLVESLTIAIEDSRIVLPDEPVLINELEAFEYETSTTGRVRYGAPEGVHDDCVIALALAWQAITRYGSSGVLI